MSKLDFEEWLKLGVEAGWIGAPVCHTHDGLPLSAAEEAEFEESDPCVHILRLYEDAESKAAVEANHAPSVWRKSNRFGETTPEERNEDAGLMG